MSELETAASAMTDIMEAEESILRLASEHQYDLRQATSTPFDSPISAFDPYESPRKTYGHDPSAPHRLSVVTIEEITGSPPRVNKRKQSHPHRAIKQLASLAEKIINGIIVIEPTMAWESPGKSSRQPRIIIENPTPVKRARSGGSSKSPTRRRDDAKDDLLRSPISEHNRSPSPNREQTGSPANNPNSKPTSVIGRHIDGDFEPERLAARVELYYAIYKKRKTPGSLASLGASKLSGFGGTPLDISQAPGACLLDENEFELCSLLRLQPLQYFQSRDTLLQNFHERGFYKKSAAQKMLHIDVNKTGRLYDFFVKMNWMPEFEEQGAMVVDPPEVDWHQLLP